MRCRACHVPMVPAGRKRVPAGHRLHKGRGLCRSCYDKERHAGRLDQWPATRFRCAGDCPFCEDVAWLAETGAPASDWAARLDTSVAALARRLYRHGRRDLGRRVERIQARQRWQDHLMRTNAIDVREAS